MINLIVNISDGKWLELLPDVENSANKIASQIFNYLKYKREKPTAFNLELSNDEEITLLNKRYRGKGQPTNVLSFACIDDEGFEEDSELFEYIELGDIIISIDTLKKEAEEKGVSLNDHFCHLLIHGILHLLGYDHIEDNEAEEMEALEIDILKTFSIPNPYQE